MVIPLRKRLLFVEEMFRLGRLVAIGHGFQLVPGVQSSSKTKTKPTLDDRRRKLFLVGR